MLSRRTRCGPGTERFQMPVCTVWPRHWTSCGKPTLTDTRVAAGGPTDGPSGVADARCCAAVTRRLVPGRRGALRPRRAHTLGPARAACQPGTPAGPTE